MNRFRFYYEVAQEILFEATPATPIAGSSSTPVKSSSASATSSVATKPESKPSIGSTPPISSTPQSTITPSTGASSTSVDVAKSSIDNKKDIKDKIDKKLIIKKPNDMLVELEKQIDDLSIKIITRKEKIDTMLEATSFLKNIDYTGNKQFSQEQEFKKLNSFLNSKAYDNLSASNFYAINNALKQNFIIARKNLQNKNDSESIRELNSIYKKYENAKFLFNIDALKNKVKQIKSNFANINQIFTLKDFDKKPITFKEQIQIAQKKSSDLIKNLS